MGSMSIWHWLIVAGIVVLLFGGGRISNVMGDLAKGVKAFKKGLEDDPVAPAALGETTTTASAKQEAAVH